ncbi:hypothetical protein IPO96_01845 [Candidatus Saccharibacteria bacterium]|jgi:uncharacterized membrane protein YidH (DUF202 family)|nr:MAG: hypothetical protein IPO96_01845 [Candidatus Saccharibacteria bacterium]
MKKLISKISTFFSSALLLASFAAPVLSPVAVHAQETPAIKQKLCEGANLQIGDNTNCADEAALESESNTAVNKTITFVINLFSVVVGVVAVIMIIFAGFKYITSGGDSGKVTSAKNTIVYAAIGLVVVALAQFIVKFVLGKASSTTSNN